MSSYARYPRHHIPWSNWITPAIRNLVIACSVVYLIEVLLRHFAVGAYAFMLYEFGLVPALVTHTSILGMHGLRIWQPVTYLFLHDPDSLWHLLLNVFFLWMFGVDLERTWGERRFYTYFFLTGIGAGLINVLVKTILDPAGIGSSRIPTIGCSGAVYAVLLAAAVMFPDRQVWLIPFPVQIPMKIYVLAAGAIEFFLTFGTGGDNVSHVAHLGGMLVGYLYLRRGSFFYRARNGISDWKQRRARQKFDRARRKFEVYQSKHRDEPPSRPDNWVH